MKIYQYLSALILTICISSCIHKVEPEVDTFYFSTGHADTLRALAISKLYAHYNESDKSKKFYEVISKKTGRYIVNYYPEAEMLTICHDPGSGWGGQFINVSESTLKKMAESKVHLNQLQQYALTDTSIQNNRPIIDVRTNGKPN